MKKILWFCGPAKYKKSGVGNYSTLYIEGLKKLGYNIHDYWINVNNDYLRGIIQFFITPLKVILFNRNQLKVFWDEGMLLYTLFPFFPYKNSIFIIHDIRDFNLSVKNKNIFQKIYFSLLERANNNIKKIKTVVVVSEFTKDKLIKQYGVKKENINLIYNAFDLSIFKKLDNIDGIREKLFSKYNIKSDKKIILNVGSEESRKNIITILKIMENVDDYIFIKLGRPIIAQNRENHLKYIQEHKLENKVYLLDFIEDMQDFVGFYNIADVFLFPSLFEGFGRPPIEAQACGCPVISSKEGALGEVLGDSAIILDNPEDVDEIIKKLKLADKVRKEKIKLGFNNIQRFSLDNNVKKWENLLDNKNLKI